MSVPVYYRPFELFVGTISEFYCEFHNRICIIWKPRHCLLHERERVKYLKRLRVTHFPSNQQLIWKMGIIKVRGTLKHKHKYIHKDALTYRS
jgi:hypothetical protein